MGSDSVHLSVIIPTLARPETARLLAQRVRDLLPDLQVEAIVVLPAHVQVPPDSVGVRFIVEARRGVYTAFRAGLERANGRYCWFMGDDDYPLDAVAELGETMRAARYDLLVAPVLFSSGRLYAPTRSRLVLHFLNWCQQGVIYRRSLFQHVRFFRRLPVLADQYVNILLHADPATRIRYFSRPICVFGVDGISGRTRDQGYARLRLPLAWRTLGFASFLAFRGLVVVTPIVKRLIKLR